jgi:hypothetical protein
MVRQSGEARSATTRMVECVSFAIMRGTALTFSLALEQGDLGTLLKAAEQIRIRCDELRLSVLTLMP